MAVAALVLTLGSAQATARTLGIDVSRWQGTINWTSVKGSGVTFAWAQATRGAYLVNANFTANMNNGKAAGVIMGAYHYACPATNSPSTEANYFWNTAGPYIKADGKTLMPMLDIEEWNGHVGASSYSDWANQWYNAVVAKAAAAGVTIKPVLYSSACFMCNFNTSCSGFGSFIANYSGAPQTGTPWSACSSCNLWGGGAWNFWQYSSTGSVPGISGAVDLDVFNGTSISAWIATAATAGSSVIVDNSNAGFTVTGTAWSTGSSSTDKYGADYRYHSTTPVSEPAQFLANVSAGAHDVAAWWTQGANRSTTASYVVAHSAGTTTVVVNQQINGGKWNSLGNFNFAGGNTTVKLSCWTTTGFIVVADGVKWQ
jgi:GH25 family lysozyme M1 (1,4-beta-N-acetylmuramidase)